SRAIPRRPVRPHRHRRRNKNGRAMTSANKTKVVLVSADEAFSAAAQATFGASKAIELVIVPESLTDAVDTLDAKGATVVVVDLDGSQDQELAALGRLIGAVGAEAPVIAVTPSFDAGVARTLVQMRVADFLVKPVAPLDLVRACAEASRKPGGKAAAPT